MNIYVATSWRNSEQPKIVRVLRDEGYRVYDFHNPSIEDKGFHWSDIDPEWKSWDAEEFRRELLDPIAIAGFERDMVAMKEADVCVMVMPCGRSAHLEAGYFVGAGKPVIILLSDGEPELMYGMCILVVNQEELSIMLQDLSRKMENSKDE